MKKWLPFVAFVALVLGFFYAISGHRAPYIPGDDVHRPLTQAALCRDCHAPGKEAPLVESHPPKEQCFSCHKRKRKGV
jgi:hypothetical protein